MTGPGEDVYEAAARAYGLAKYNYPVDDGYVSPEARERHIANDARSTAEEAPLRAAVDAGFAAGVAAGRTQVLAVLRDDALYHEWNRRWGLDPAGPRSWVDAVQRDVIRDFAEWATGGEPRG